MKNNADTEPKNKKTSLEVAEAAPTSGETHYSTVSVSLRDMPAEPNTAPESRLGERARYARNDLKLNIEALSRLTKEYDPQGSGLSPTSIARYESGESLPGIREFRILCESLEIPLAWLLYGDPTEEKNGLELTEAEQHVLIGLRVMMAEKKDDFSLAPTEFERGRLKADIRNAKLTKARKPQT